MAKLGQYGHQLENMTAQEVLDVGVEHLLTQMEKSREYEGSRFCLYKGPNGLCCAAAPFIRDEEAFGYLGGWDAIVCKGWASSNHKRLITDLQSTHDDYEVLDWALELKRLAKDYDLQYNGEQYE